MGLQVGIKKSWFRRITGTLLILLSAAFTVYLCVIMFHRINSVVLKDSYVKVFMYELGVCLCFLVLSVDIRFGILTKMRKKSVKAFGWLLRIVLVLAVGFVIYLGAKISVGGTIQTPGVADNAVVLGLALQDGQPAPDLISRVDVAADYALKYPTAKLILTGGNPDENGITEAAVMRELLVERGVPEDQMIIEDNAETTIENLRNTAQIINPSRPVILISSDYHMDRAVRTAEDAGFKYVMRYPAQSSKTEYAANVMWEVIQELNRLTSNIKLPF